MGKFFQKRSEIPIAQSNIDPDKYITLAELKYQTKKGESIEVPKGYITDGYSKPIWAKSLVDGSFGDDIRPALIHDYLCQNKGYWEYNTINSKRFQPLSFKRVNDIFLEAMKDADIPFFRRWLYRIAVSFNPNKW